MKKARLRLEKYSRIVAGTTLLCVVVLLRAISSYVFMFSRFADYDDEGNILLSIKQFLEGNALYDEIFAQYGPFFFILSKAIFGTGLVELGHDSGRILTYVIWLAIVGIFSSTTWRLTRSYILLIIVIFLSFDYLSFLAREPLHPQIFCLLLLSLIMFVSTFFSEKIATNKPLIIGALAACLLMIKINIGIFALAGLILALLALTKGRLATAFAWICGGLTGLLPAVLMRSDLGSAYGRSFAFIVGMALVLLTVATLHGSRNALFGWRTSVTTGVSCIATVSLICTLTLIEGTTLKGLLHGVVLQHIDFAEVFFIRAPISASGVLTTVVSCLMLTAILVLQRKDVSTHLVRAIVGLKALFCVSVFCFSFADGRVSALLNFVVPFLWIALVPAQFKHERRDALVFGRVAIVFIAALQVLAAYPVAGSQGRAATVAIILVAVICANDVGRHIPSRWHDWRVQVAGWCLLAVFIVPYQWTRASWNIKIYNSSIPLNLPGANRICLRPSRTALYRALSFNLKECNDSFLSLPGLNSFYFWAEKKPPTNQNTTHWMTHLDTATQEEIIEQVSTRADLCAIRNQSLAQWWVVNRDLDEFPLVRYMDTEFKTIGRIDGYEFMIRRHRPFYELKYAVYHLDADRQTSMTGEARIRWLLRLLLPAMPEPPVQRVALFDTKQRQTLADSGEQGRSNPLVVFSSGGQGRPVLAPGIAGSITLERPRELVLHAFLSQQGSPHSKLVVLLFDGAGGLIAPVPFIEVAGPQSPERHPEDD